VKVRRQDLQMPRRTSIQSWVSSWACLRRQPCPVIESHKHFGQRRGICSLPVAAQSKSGLQGSPWSGIKTIVLHGKLSFWTEPVRIRVQKRASSSPRN